jgi:hypothetical protein
MSGGASYDLEFLGSSDLRSRIQYHDSNLDHNRVFQKYQSTEPRRSSLTARSNDSNSEDDDGFSDVDKIMKLSQPGVWRRREFLWRSQYFW